MSEFKSLVAKVKKAADDVRGQIQALDEEIAVLEEQRRIINNAPVSKADFMDYVREDIRRRSARLPYVLKQKWARDGQYNNFVRLERYFTNGDLQPIPYINGEVPTPGVNLDPDAFYWYFGGLIIERFEQAIEGLDWPEDTMPVLHRRQRLEDLDAKIQELLSRRDELAADLQSVAVE